MDPKFVHYDLSLIKPEFDSKLTDLVIELDYLRKKQLGGSTHPKIFFQLKRIFHTLESIGSARIEGNNTTITDYIENRSESNSHKNENIIEIQNIENSMNFIDENISTISINRAFMSDLHKHIVKDLTPPPNGEGDKTPGNYRKHGIKINKSNHLPPMPAQINGYMDELFSFINREESSKYDLIKTAIAHHRFVWIHPFGNGNGRTVRLFTYAMLVQQGFNINLGRIVNPTAVFCNNRDNYYEYLSKADTGEKLGLEKWCEYVLNGLKAEIEKIDLLLDYRYLSKNILRKAISYSKDIGAIKDNEFKILNIAVDKQVFQASDLKSIFPKKLSAEVSRNIRKLKDKNLIISERKNSRKYIISFKNTILLKGIIKALDDNNFLPIKDEIASV